MSQGARGHGAGAAGPGPTPSERSAATSVIVPAWPAATTDSTSDRVDTPMVTSLVSEGAIRLLDGWFISSRVAPRTTTVTPADPVEPAPLDVGVSSTSTGAPSNKPVSETGSTATLTGRSVAPPPAGTSIDVWISSPGSTAIGQYPALDAGGLAKCLVGRRLRQPHARGGEVAGAEDGAGAEGLAGHHPGVIRFGRAGQGDAEDEHRGGGHQETAHDGPPRRQAANPARTDNSGRGRLVGSARNQLLSPAPGAFRHPPDHT